ncbi:LuxR C-terminal-related transcriptional regulator [Thalassotalea nanhaiensis]|uniref:LuxR C-terminal-related transcriptional regulator n=1 Tax=Thalassotalea nanhaiensis TaxID=3065648 RepID=A0ABY9TEG9_9GAMM|nr:LuxR C-terminal-related transcriptional regulator [Colwelliaceae bacterium SQ345]
MQKYVVPIKPVKLYRRTRLIEQIDISLSGQAKFLFIKAPAGYGKSYLMIDYANHILQQSGLVVWTSLDSDDNKSEFFFSYFIDSLKAQGLVNDGLFYDENISQLSFVYQIISELQSCNKPVFLFFDDFHNIHNRVIADFFQQLIVNSSEKINVVIASRIDLPFPIAKAYVAEKVCKLKAHELAFTENEILQYFEKFNQRLLTADEVSNVFSMTGGWPAVISMHKNLSHWTTGSTNEENLAAYFLEEIFVGLSEQEKHCLLLISISDFLCEQLIDTITDSSDFSANVIKKFPVMRLHKKNLTERFEWFALQPLLKDYLYQQLSIHNRDDIKDLHQRCANWYLSNHIFLEAVDHCIKAEQYQSAVAILEEHGNTIIASGNFPRFNVLISQLPYDVLLSNIYLLVLQAWNYSLTYQHRKGELVIENLESMLNQKSEVSEREQLKLLAVKAAHAAWTDNFSNYQQRVDNAMSKRPLALPHFENSLRVVQCIGFLHSNQFEKLRETGEDAEFFARGGSLFYSTVTIKVTLAMLEFIQGNTEQCLGKCDEVTAFINSQQHDSQLAHMVNVMRGMAAYITGDLKLTKQFFDTSGSIISYIAEPSFLAWYYVTHIQLLTDLNENEQRELMIEQLLELLESRQISTSKIPLYYEAIRYYLFTANPEEANTIYESFKAENINTHTQENNHLLFNASMIDCLMLSANGDMEICIVKLTQVINDFEQSSRTLQQVRALVFLVNIYIIGKDIHNAKIALKKVISIASKKNIIQYLGRLDKVAIDLLNEWSLTELSPRRKTFMQDICKRFEGLDMRKRFELQLVEDLTAAEQKVMQLLGTGNSNQQIADQLCVSINTVKTHLKTSYAKLGVSNRIQAIQVFGQMQQTKNQW